MGKIIFFSIFSVALLVIIAVGGSYLVVYWRDTRRRWRIENQQDERRLLQESFQDLTNISEKNTKAGKL